VVRWLLKPDKVFRVEKHLLLLLLEVETRIIQQLAF
jgi:hypothetical protein